MSVLIRKDKHECCVCSKNTDRIERELSLCEECAKDYKVAVVFGLPIPVLNSIESSPVLDIDYEEPSECK